MGKTAFHSFIIFAEMRTGSNFLESNLQAIDGLDCSGEAFNAEFIGYMNRKKMHGVTLQQRRDDPHLLLNAIKDQDGICGFRYFHDHEPRIFDSVMDDPGWAKIILTRNPLDSYVSWKIAQKTGQWKLTDGKARKSAQAHFDIKEFQSRLARLQGFQQKLLNALQKRGQTAFYLAYEDLQNIDVINGLAAYLGVEGRLSSLVQNLKKQNPSPLEDKVENHDEMAHALAGLDWFDMSRTPNFEPRRGPNVPSYHAAAKSPLLFMPISGAPVTEIQQWMADLDGVSLDAIQTKMTQKNLRQWKRKMVGHRSFTVVRHPVQRAYEVFCHRILNIGKGGFIQLRKTLKKRYKIGLPDDPEALDYDLAAHRAAFAAFLQFLKPNLAGQTTVRVDGAWCTQAQTVEGFAGFALPDLIIREEELTEELSRLAKHVGRASPRLKLSDRAMRYALADLYDQEIESLVKDVYQRDYMMFGFGPWAPLNGD